MFKKKKIKKLKRAIENEGLFSKTYYLKHNHSARVSDLKPIEHYLKYGAKEDKKPNENFDLIWYKTNYKDVSNDSVTALEHYILYGKAENRFINATEYRKYQTIQDCDKFDEIFYKNAYEDLRKMKDGFDFLLHYVRYGEQEGRNPSENFDSKWYKEAYSDVNEKNLCSLEHYILFGKAENKFINITEYKKYETLKKSGQFDKDFYRSSYEDLRKLEDNFDFLLHYVRYGITEGRKAFPDKTNIIKNTEIILNNNDNKLTKQEQAEYEILFNYNLNWSQYKTLNIHISPHEDPIVDYIKNWKIFKPIIADFFDTSFYLDVYPDVLNSKLNPLVHYLISGKEEGRQALFNEENLLKGKVEYTDTKETIIFVSHESSASGAPLLGYNIADKLIKKYNIVHIIIRKSDIHESFLNNCDLMFYGIETDTTNNAYIFIKRLQKSRQIKCVICNSIITFPVLHAAYTLDIPTLLLIHEFSDYIKPAATVMNTIFLADNVIVPATIIQDSIQEELIKYSNNKTIPSNIHIIPQGKLPYIPQDYGKNDSIETLYAKLKIDSPENIKIIVGSGWVQIRKGVDLFVEMAKKIKKNYDGKCKFVWVGGGFDPEIDLAYSVWLNRELKYSGLDEDFLFLEHQKNLDTIFSISDVFCLTSRMDPFPNVVIDALEHNLHVACFDNASGSSEFLEKHNANCTIVDYVDTYQLAIEIVKYLNTKTKIDNTNQNIVHKYLDFDNYVNSIDNLIEQSIEFKQKSQNIIKELLSTNEFNSEYFGGDDNVNKHCRSYVETSLKGVRLQNPKPGFSELKYLTENTNGSGIVPLYEGLKNLKTSTHSTQLIPFNTDETIDFFYAVHLHLFYVDLADEFAEYFKKLPGRFDILITIVNEEDRDPAMKIFSSCGANAVKIVYVKNIGRDSGPLFFGVKEEVLQGSYKVIGHFHTKKSFDNVDGIGNRWRKFLTETLLGDKNISKSILSLFNNTKLGLVFPDDSHVVNIGENKEYIDNLCKMMHIPNIKETAVFPLGNMFWARVDAIKDLFELNPEIILQEEPLPYDGSYMHAIERITPSLVEKNTYMYTTVYREGLKW